LYGKRIFSFWPLPWQRKNWFVLARIMDGCEWQKAFPWPFPVNSKKWLLKISIYRMVTLVYRKRS
jgi:hypothetical protein